jgi:perosamine synthetase
MKIPLSLPNIGEREIEYVTRVLRSGRLSIGPFVEEFEARFAEYVGRKHAIAVNSGTSALHLCVAALGIGPKDEVLTTSFTFVASANCMLFQGAVPSFVDIDPVTLNIDPKALRAAIERDYIVDKARKRLVNRLSGRVLKAILPVHVFGVPCDMDAIVQIANEWNLFIIEDACEALGAHVAGRSAGGVGHAAAFAFYPNKQITSGEGGMVVTDDDGIAQYCREMRNQGRDDTTAWLRHVSLGFNYRLSELHSAVGLAQLERIEDLLTARATVAQAYNERLGCIPQIGLPHVPARGARSWFAYVIYLKGPAGPVLRDRMMHGLQARGVACQSYFPSIHLQPYFESVRRLPARPLPNSEAASQRCLALPFFPSMTDEQLDTVCYAIHQTLCDSPSLSPRPLRLERARGAA